jgi:tetratricopeptide (TPR) repeat protein
MAAIAKGNTVGALKLADNCIAEDRAAAAPPLVKLGDASFVNVINVHFWQLGRALLYAKLGRPADADRALANANQWLQQYGLDVPNWLLPFVPLSDATRGCLAERRGENDSAVNYYNLSGFAPARIALIALEAGGEKDAETRATAILKDAPQEPTALYVMGRLADRHNATHAAITYYELALNGIAKTIAGNPSFPLGYIEGDRITNALAAARLR